MRTLLALSLVAAFLLLSAAPVDAEGWGVERWTKRSSSWAGHAVGSMTHRRTTQNMNIPGVGPQKTVTEEKKTITKITETEFVIKVERLTAGQWTTSEEKEPKVWKTTGEPKIEDVGADSVTIEGTAYPCKKKKIDKLFVAGAGAPKQGASPNGVAWVNDKHGVLKMEMNMTAMGQSLKTTWQVQKLKATHKVGTTDLAGREIKLTNSMMGGDGLVMLQSSTVPGGTLRSEMKINPGGMAMTTVTELIAYVKK